MCTCMWCGDAYKDRVVFLISNRFITHTTMWIEDSLIPLMYTQKNSQFTNYDTQSVYII